MTEELDFTGFDDTEEQSDDLLARISAAVSQWETLSNEMAELEAQLDARRGEIKFLAENLVPDLMKEARQEQITSLGGFHVEVKETMYAHVPPASAKDPDAVKRRWAAYQWLDANGYGHLIDRKIEVTFDRTAEGQAKELLKKLRDEKYTAAPNYSLHHMRLQGFVREAMEKGVNIPEDTFALRPYARAEVKGPDGKKLRSPKASDE